MTASPGEADAGLGFGPAFWKLASFQIGSYNLRSRSNRRDLFDGSPGPVRPPLPAAVRRPGRTTRPCRLIAEAARQAFMANGFAGTSMDDVAQTAGVSKKTLYRLVPNKAGLFESSVTTASPRGSCWRSIRCTGRAACRHGVGSDHGGVRPSHPVAGHGGDPEAGHRRERPFPGLWPTTFFHGCGRGDAAGSGRLSRPAMRARNPSVSKIPTWRRACFGGMMAMEPQRPAMMKQRALPSYEEITARGSPLCPSVPVRHRGESLIGHDLTGRTGHYRSAAASAAVFVAFVPIAVGRRLGIAGKAGRTA